VGPFSRIVMGAEAEAGLVVEISIPELAAVEVSGDGNMSMDDVEGDSFEAE
jgi:hypothetical protein